MVASLHLYVQYFADCKLPLFVYFFLPFESSFLILHYWLLQICTIYIYYWKIRNRAPQICTELSVTLIAYWMVSSFSTNRCMHWHSGSAARLFGYICDAVVGCYRSWHTMGAQVLAANRPQRSEDRAGCEQVANGTKVWCVSQDVAVQNKNTCWGLIPATNQSNWTSSLYLTLLHRRKLDRRLHRPLYQHTGRHQTGIPAQSTEEAKLTWRDNFLTWQHKMLIYFFYLYISKSDIWIQDCQQYFHFTFRQKTKQNKYFLLFISRRIKMQFIFGDYKSGF